MRMSPHFIREKAPLHRKNIVQRLGESNNLQIQSTKQIAKDKNT